MAERRPPSDSQAPPDARERRNVRDSHAGGPARSALLSRVGGTLRDVLPLMVLASAIVGVPVLVFEPQGLPRLRLLERECEQVDAENRAQEREIAHLRAQVHALKDDLGAVEKVARRELGLIRKSEIVFQLPRGATGND